MVVKGKTKSMGLGMYVIHPSLITYAEQDKEYFVVHFVNGSESIRVHGSSKEADALFPFLVRIQRTYLINLTNVSSVHSRIKRQVDVAFTNGTKVEFIKSEIHHDKFMEAFEKL